MVDKSTGQSRGIGFVRFESQGQSEAALSAMNQKKLSEDSPILTVKFAESPEQKVNMMVIIILLFKPLILT